jgi:hypothetical protein
MEESKCTSVPRHESVQHVSCMGDMRNAYIIFALIPEGRDHFEE